MSSIPNVRRYFAPLLAALVLVAQAGCSVKSAGPGTPSGTRTVVFANESVHFAEVWVMAPEVNGERVGTVLAGETARLRVPQKFFERGTISFYAHLRERNNMPLLDKLPVKADEDLRLRLPLDTKRLEAVR